MFLRIGFLLIALSVIGPAYAADAPSAGPAAPATPAATTTDAATPAPPVAPDTEAPVVPSAPVVYIPPTLPDLYRTLARFNAIDLREDVLLDEYASVTDCEIYRYFYKDDFKWNEIRKKMRTSLDMNANTYPAHYSYTTGLQLDRYDFSKKMYRFTDATTIRNINLFTLFKPPLPACGDKTIQYLPKDIQAVADVPFSMLGIPLTPADAQGVLNQMNLDKNTSHTILVQFNLTITFIDRLKKEVVDTAAKSKVTRYYQVLGSNAKASTSFRLDAHIDSVNFYEDATMKNLIYTIKL